MPFALVNKSTGVVEQVDRTGRDLDTLTKNLAKLPDNATHQWFECPDDVCFGHNYNATKGQFTAPSPPPPTEEDYSEAIQAMLDAKAREHQYDSIGSAVSYRGDANATYNAEAEALFAWRSAVWVYATAQLTAVKTGNRSQPTISDFLTEIGAQCPFTWPR